MMKRLALAIGFCMLGACSTPDTDNGPGTYSVERKDATYEVLIPAPPTDPAVTRLESIRTGSGATDPTLEYARVCIDNTKGKEALEPPVLTIVTMDGQQRQSLAPEEAATELRETIKDEAARTSLTEAIAQQQQSSFAQPGQKTCSLLMFKKPLPSRFQKIQASFGKVQANNVIETVDLKPVS